MAQSAQRTIQGGQPKLYALQAPRVECISKGKACRPCEFGVKVGIASTFKGNLVVSVWVFHRMGRCHLKGELGDRLHAVLCAGGYSIIWLLCMIARKGVSFL